MTLGRRLLLSAISLIAAWQIACGYEPSDEELIARFRAKEQSFEKLAQSVEADTDSGACPPQFDLPVYIEAARGISVQKATDYRKLMEVACPDCTLFRGPDENLKILVSASGTAYKGYMHTRSHVRDVVGDLNYTPPDLRDCSFHYRLIGNGWYIYYLGCR